MIAQKLSSDVASKRLDENVNVIVRFSEVPTDHHHHLVQQHSGIYYRDLGKFKSGAYSVPASELSNLAASQSITHISVDHQIHALLDNTTAAVNAAAAWDRGYQGTGIGIAVLDSGISDMDDLSQEG